MIEYLSYSRIKTLSDGLFYFKYRYIDKTAKDKESSALTLGDIVDCLLTTPEKFDELFIIASVPKPTGQMGIYTEQMFYFAHTLDLPDEAEEKAYEALKEINGGKLQATLSKFQERFKTEGKEYYEFLFSCIDKQVISTEEYLKANRIVNSIKYGKYTSFLFQDRENIEMYNQYEFDLEASTVIGERRFKGKIDFLEVNHNDKEIIVYDLKTTGNSVLDFIDSFYKWGYMYQASIYVAAIQRIFVKLFEEGYKVRFKFIVENSDYPNIPVIYNVEHKTLLNTWLNDMEYKGKTYKSINRLLKELSYYEENGYSEYYESAVNNGNLVI